VRKKGDIKKKPKRPSENRLLLNRPKPYNFNGLLGGVGAGAKKVKVLGREERLKKKKICVEGKKSKGDGGGGFPG